MLGKFTRSNLKELKLKIIAVTQLAMSLSEDEELVDIFRTSGALLCAGIDSILEQLKEGDTISYIVSKGQ